MWIYFILSVWDLGEVVQSCMQAGVHASGRFSSEFEAILQDGARDQVLMVAGDRFSTHKHSVVWVSTAACVLQQLLQMTQPLRKQVNILKQKNQ